jgi:hypothetical protein
MQIQSLLGSGVREKNSLKLPSYYSCIESCRIPMAINYYHTITSISATFHRFCRLHQSLPPASQTLPRAATVTTTTKMTTMMMTTTTMTMTTTTTTTMAMTKTTTALGHGRACRPSAPARQLSLCQGACSALAGASPPPASTFVCIARGGQS